MRLNAKRNLHRHQTLPAALVGACLLSGLMHAQTLESLHSFTGVDGQNPYMAGLVQGRDGNLYGTTYFGGTFSKGTVFRVLMPPQTRPTLNISRQMNHVILTWPTNVAFFLQASPLPATAYTNVTGATNPSSIQ